MVYCSLKFYPSYLYYFSFTFDRMRNSEYSRQLRGLSKPIAVLKPAWERSPALLVGEKLTATKELGP
jgi:hypothetical protein